MKVKDTALSKAAGGANLYSTFKLRYPVLPGDPNKFNFVKEDWFKVALVHDPNEKLPYAREAADYMNKAIYYGVKTGAMKDSGSFNSYVKEILNKAIDQNNDVKAHKSALSSKTKELSKKIKDYQQYKKDNRNILGIQIKKVKEPKQKDLNKFAFKGSF